MRFIPLPLSVQLLVLPIFSLPSRSRVLLFLLFSPSRPSCVQPFKCIKLSLNWCLAANFSSETSILHPHWSGWEARELVWAQNLTFNMLTASYRANDHATVINSLCKLQTPLFFFNLKKQITSPTIGDTPPPLITFLRRNLNKLALN